MKVFRSLRVLATGVGVVLVASVAPHGAAPAFAAGAGVIAGTIYNDANADGFDANELVAPGVTVYLDANRNGQLDTGETSTVTDVFGQYDLSSLNAGTYAVRLKAPSVSRYVHPGEVAVTTGQNGRHDGSVTYGGSISGTIFNDLNGNTQPDSDDVAAPGQVYIDNPSGGAVGQVDTGDRTVVADANGHYVFPSVPDGTYTLYFNAFQTGSPPGLHSRSVQVVGGQATTNVNYGVSFTGAVVGRVYVDLNRNHRYEVGEEVPGVDVSFLRHDLSGDLETYETAADGTFAFPSVANSSTANLYLLDPDDPSDLSTSFGPFTVTSGNTVVANIGLDFPDVGGYRVATADGNVFNYGDSRNFGSLEGKHLNAPIIAMASLPDGSGYWLFAGDGGVFSFGEAAFYGSTGNLHLNKPIVSMAVAPDGRGYWLVASDGGVFAFGSAAFSGSTGGISLNKPIVGMAADPDGSGYWLVASDGGIFAFDADFAGSTGGTPLNKPIVAMAPNPDGDGYWLVASDGGIFGFNAPFFGSAGSLKLNSPIVAMASAAAGDGYYLLAADGGIFTFPSDRPFFGSPASSKGSAPAVAISVF